MDFIRGLRQGSGYILAMFASMAFCVFLLALFFGGPPLVAAVCARVVMGVVG